MKSDCCFDECKDCLHKEYSDDLCCCTTSRLTLAWYRLLKELPIVNKFIDNYKYCNWYEKER